MEGKQVDHRNLVPYSTIASCRIKRRELQRWARTAPPQTARPEGCTRLLSKQPRPIDQTGPTPLFDIGENLPDQLIVSKHTPAENPIVTMEPNRPHYQDS
jgi:hypothetical protein